MSKCTLTSFRTYPRSLRTSLGALATIIVLTFSNSSVWAWGKEGHRIIAELAWQQLTPNAMQEVKELLGDKPKFVSSATWADEIIRQRRNTAPWHYVNLPTDRSTYREDLDCPKKNCVVAQIDEAAKTLADRTLLKPVRAVALKFLIHFVGDIHQPLHAGYGHDRGGNEVWVRIAGKTDRLHSWWDTDLLHRYWKHEADALNELGSSLAAAKTAEWTKVTSPVAWANESNKVVHDFVYPSGLTGTNTKETAVIVPTSYQEAARPIIKERLMAAGVRLGSAINEALR